tara:strand:+ start:11435 stop:11803 length:369 start_codon:yes stop_codon:yes gene_type:complete
VIALANAFVSLAPQTPLVFPSQSNESVLRAQNLGSSHAPSNEEAHEFKAGLIEQSRTSVPVLQISGSSQTPLFAVAQTVVSSPTDIGAVFTGLDRQSLVSVPVAQTHGSSQTPSFLNSHALA